MSISAVHFFYCTVVVSRSVWRDLLCQGHFIYFKTLIIAIHQKKQPVVDLRVLCFFEESNCSPALLKVLAYSTVVDAVTVVWRVVLSALKH